GAIREPENRYLIGFSKARDWDPTDFCHPSLFGLRLGRPRLKNHGQDRVAFNEAALEIVNLSMAGVRGVQEPLAISNVHVKIRVIRIRERSSRPRPMKDMSKSSLSLKLNGSVGFACNERQLDEDE